MKNIALSIVSMALAVTSGASNAQSSPRQEATGMSVAEYEATVMGLPLFSELQRNWVQKAKAGDIAHKYDKVRVVKTFPAGEQVVFPKKGDMIIYQTTGTSYSNPFQRPEEELLSSKSTRIVAVNAKTKEVIAWKELPLELKGNPHSSPVSPDGRYIYVGGPPLTNFEDLVLDESMTDNTGCTSPVCSVIPTTIIKVDSLTLEAVAVLTAPGRLHHGHVFRDRYMLMDTFIRDEDGVDTYIFDTQTDTVVSGVRGEDLGGSAYTSWTDHDNKHVYQLMEPQGYGDRKVFDGYISAHWIRQNDVNALRPFWVTKFAISDDATEWEVVKEYPYFGYRSAWVEVSPDDQFMYVTASGMNIVQKIHLETGRKVWSTPVGDGPYGAELNADGSQLWVANKGETTDMWGHDISVINAVTGMREHLISTGWTTDHIILSPDGTEMWTSSNGAGKLYVYDAETYEEKAVVDMPGFGDPHGVPFVYYDEDEQGRLVTDMNGFHGGVDAQRGNPISYQ